MTIELDHFFVVTSPGAPGADLLTEIGLVEGTSNDHPGQGTANRRFFFANWVLELIYIRDAEEALNSKASGIRIVERAANPKASPFGLIVHRTTDDTADPFAGWRYYPEYFSADKYFLVGDNTDILEEPSCICMPIRAPARPAQPPQSDSFTQVTELFISVPVDQPSTVLQTFGECDGVSLRIGEPHCMEIVFKDGEQGRSKNLNPDLPLIIRW